MKKFLFCLFAGMMFVPTFVGCGQSTEAVIPEEDKSEDPLNGQSEDAYMQQMQEGQEEGAEEGQ